MMTWLDELKVGDPVFVHGGGYSSSLSSHRVTRVMHSQIIVGTIRFNRKSGRQVGRGYGGSFLSQFDRAEWEVVCAERRDKEQVFSARKAVSSAEITPAQARAILAIMQPDSTLGNEKEK